MTNKWQKTVTEGQPAPAQGRGRRRTEQLNQLDSVLERLESAGGRPEGGRTQTKRVVLETVCEIGALQPQGITLEPGKPPLQEAVQGLCSAQKVLREQKASGVTGYRLKDAERANESALLSITHGLHLRHEAVLPKIPYREQESAWRLIEWACVPYIAIVQNLAEAGAQDLAQHTPQGLAHTQDLVTVAQRTMALHRLGEKVHALYECYGKTQESWDAKRSTIQQELAEASADYRQAMPDGPLSGSIQEALKMLENPASPKVAEQAYQKLALRVVNLVRHFPEKIETAYREDMKTAVRGDIHPLLQMPQTAKEIYRVRWARAADRGFSLVDANYSTLLDSSNVVQMGDLKATGHAGRIAAEPDQPRTKDS